MAMGMPRDEYWYGDVWAVRDYKKAYQEKLKAEDHNNWMQGFYVYGALIAASPAFRDFTKERKPRPYIKEPATVRAEKEKELSRKDQMKQGKKFFEDFVNAFNARFKQKQEGGRP